MKSLKQIILLVPFMITLGCVAPVLADTNNHVNPDISRADNGSYYVTWFDRTRENIMLQKVNASGENQWVTPTQVNIYGLSTLTGWDQEPQVAVHGSHIYVVWAQSPGTLSMMKLDSNGNRLWATEPNVNSEPNEYLGHDIACDSNGFIYINYREYGPYGGSSYLSKVNSDGVRQFVADAFCGQGGYSGKQAIAIGPNNEIYCYSTHSGTAWIHRMDANGNKLWGIEPGTGGSMAVDSTGLLILAGRNGQEVILKKYNSAGTQVGNDIAVSSGADAKYPFVSLDSANNAYVVWQDERSGNIGYDWEIMANKINSSGTRLWSADKLVNTADEPEHTNPACAADEAGGVMAVWHNAVQGGYENIHLNRLNSNGTRYFGADINIHGGSTGGGNEAPVITSTPITVYPVDVITQDQVTATDPDGDNLTYSVANGPTGYSINSSSGLITWTPGGSSVGFYSITIQVSDGNGGIDTQSFTIEVPEPSSGDESLVIYADSFTGGYNTYQYNTNTSNVVNDSSNPHSGMNNIKFTAISAGSNANARFDLYHGANITADGLDLSSYEAIEFFMKASEPCEVWLRVGVGGLDSGYKQTRVGVGTTYQPYTLDLTTMNVGDKTDINSLLAVTIQAGDNGGSFNHVIYVDDVQFTGGTPPTPDTTAPSVPAGLAATATSTSQINLSWNASTDNVGVTGYNIYRGGSLLKTVTTTNFSDSGLNANTTYSYKVSAYDLAGNTSAQSSVASATTEDEPAPPVGYPAVIFGDTFNGGGFNAYVYKSTRSIVVNDTSNPHTGPQNVKFTAKSSASNANARFDLYNGANIAANGVDMSAFGTYELWIKASAPCTVWLRVGVGGLDSGYKQTRVDLSTGYQKYTVDISPMAVGTRTDINTLLALTIQAGDNSGSFDHTIYVDDITLS